MPVTAVVRSTLLVAAVGAGVLSAPPQSAPVYDPMRDSLATDEVQPIYSTDIDDPWNRTFHLLFTRSLRAGLLDERAPLRMDAPPVTGRVIARIESGDRAVDPLYPSWTWMGSTAFDMSPEGHWRILVDPRYAELVAALKALPAHARSRPPLARALMQTDLWAAYDTLRVMRPMAGRGASPEAIQRMDRAAALGPLLGDAIGALALTRDEIAALPDNYAAAVRSGDLPPVFDRESGWLEVRSGRSHEQAFGDRRVARVFLRPSSPPPAKAEWLETLRGQSGDGASAAAAALVIRVLLIAGTGFGVLFTFATHGPSTAEWQKPDDPPRGIEVARRKMASEDYAALASLMRRPSPAR